MSVSTSCGLSVDEARRIDRLLDSTAAPSSELCIYRSTGESTSGPIVIRQPDGTPYGLNEARANL